MRLSLVNGIMAAVVTGFLSSACRTTTSSSTEPSQVKEASPQAPTQLDGLAAPDGEAAAVPVLSITPGTFKLYKTRNATISKTCDVYLWLEFKQDNEKMTATLERRLSGVCEIAVRPDRRVFELSGHKTECGSNFYQNSDSVNQGYKLTVMDHRTWNCPDMPPALVVIDYVAGTGGAVQYFSFDGGS